MVINIIMNVKTRIVYSFIKKSIIPFSDGRYSGLHLKYIYIFYPQIVFKKRFVVTAMNHFGKTKIILPFTTLR